MNSEQLKINIELVESLLKLDINAILSKIYTESDDIENIPIGKYTVVEFSNLYKRVLLQLKVELTEGLGIKLPEIYNFQNEFGSGNLSNTLSTFKNEIENISVQSIQNAESKLDSLIYYEIVNGFYDKSNINIHSLRGLNVSEMENSLELLSKQLHENMNMKNTLFEEVEGKIKNLQELIDQKRTELNQIASNVETSNQDSKTISDLLNKSTEYSIKISSSLEQVNNTIADSKNKISEETKLFEEYKSNLTSLVNSENQNLDKMTSQIEMFEEQLNFVNSKKEYFEERNNYLDDLIGREVGASLFETFKQRKNELSKSLEFWKYSVLVASILLTIVLIALFWEIPPNADWEYFTVRSLKTIPIGILLYFTIRQYSRERSFQEEYAFKSACALTIQAYSNLIKDEKDKDKLIFEGVLNVYKSPILEKYKESKQNDDTMDILKNVSETVKNVSKK